MDTMQTIDLILALKEMKKKAEVTKLKAMNEISEADGVLAAVKHLENELSMQIEMYNKSRVVDK